MVMNAFDTNFDAENEVYAVNTVANAYMHEPIRVTVGRPVRIYLVNVTEFDLVNSLHLHGMFFDVYRTGTSLTPSERTDTLMLCQGERAILETTFRYPGDFMFHAHQSEFAELGWMGLFQRGGRDHMTRRVLLGACAARCCLAALLFVIVRSGPADAVRGENFPPVERLTFQRVTLEPGAIVATVMNDGPDEVTIAQVQVDDAFWTFTADKGSCAAAPGPDDAADPVSLGGRRSARRATCSRPPEPRSSTRFPSPSRRRGRAPASSACSR